MIDQDIAEYKVVAKVGQGGMGEVFRAKDKKLGRDVAIKILPKTFAKDQARIARFTREAKTLASINHPNIATIYGLEQTGDVQAIVMELVEGEDLAQRLKRGAFEVVEALDVCRQISEALEAAHEKGIVHRDLKPANVMLTPRGKVKLLDFGLAKTNTSVTSDAAESESQSRTVTAAVTVPGTIIGTTAYMSPEQARGEDVEKRSDIWSFGVILLECLTGKQVFGGKTTADVLGAVLHQSVDWEALPKDTPPTIHLLLRKCLAKDRLKRLADISVARIDLDEAIADPDSSFLQLRTRNNRPPSSTKNWTMGVIAGLSSALVFAAIGWFIKPAIELRDVTALPVRHLNVALGFSGRLSLNKDTSIRISPDGSTLAFLAVPDNGSGQPQLYLKQVDRLDEITSWPIAEKVSNFGFSPDGHWIAYHSPTEDALLKVPVSGGTPIPLCDGYMSRGFYWSEDNAIVFFSNQDQALMRVADSGGTPERLNAATEGEMTFAWPQLLPENKAVLYTARAKGTTIDEANIMLQRLESGRPVGQPEVVWQGGYQARFLPSGHLIYVSKGAIFAAAFDLSSFQIKANPVSVIDQLASNGHGGAPYDVTADGMLVYVQGSLNVEPLYNFEWLDRNGIREPCPLPAGAYGWFQLSPNGRVIAYDLNDGEQSDIWLYDMEHEYHTKLTVDKENEYRPVWSPSGESVVFAQDVDGVGNLYWKRADGTGETHRLTETSHGQFPWSWHSEGRYIAINESSAEGGPNLRIVELQGDDSHGWEAIGTTDFESTQHVEVTGSFSPDGNWLAFASNEPGQFQVFVRPFGKAGVRKQISLSNRASYLPAWTLEGNELIFATNTTGHKTGVRQIMAAEYSTQDEAFNIGQAEPWKAGRFFQKQGFKSYDVHPDGSRLLIRKLAEGEEERIFDHVVFFENFAEYLKQEVPTGIE